MLNAGDRELAVLVYDGDCAFCNRSLQFGLKNLAWFPAYKAFQHLPNGAFGLNRTDFESSIWLIGASAKFAGHRAAAWILLQQKNPLLRLLGALIELAGPISALAYAWIAKNRHRLPGGTAACEISPGLESDVTSKKKSDLK
jgi:predicted DCC family thiol-disulfide oxidoreductase YuxK